MSNSFDLLVIGGGITGAGVARDAARRGLSVALVERDDIASGTSSRSSRLIHGGVRYLEHGYLKLVFEASRERSILLRTAPHLVRPLAFTWPVYEGARIPKWKVGAGLALYDTLALFQNVGRSRRLNAKRVAMREPALATSELTGGVAYWDAATDDVRLTLATAADAAASGATIWTHLEVVALQSEGERVVGAIARDRLTGEEAELSASVVISAAGPWSDRILRMADPAAQAAVRGTKGIHVLVPRERVRLTGAVTLLAPQDGRVFFALPAGDAFTILGTTDTPTSADPATVRASAADVHYLLTAANHYFPDAWLTPDDVISRWAGIRPLAAAGYGSGPSSASREHAISRPRPGLLVATGGKLTTYRSMAAEIVDAAFGELGRKVPPDADTDTRPLPGGESPTAAAAAAASAISGDTAVGARLAAAYGSRWREVWSRAEREQALRARITPEHPYLLAEVAHAVDAEWARTLGDVLIRRIPLAFESRDQGRAAARTILPYVAERLEWDEARQAEALVSYEAEVERIFGEGPAE